MLLLQTYKDANVAPNLDNEAISSQMLSNLLHNIVTTDTQNPGRVKPLLSNKLSCQTVTLEV